MFSFGSSETSNLLLLKLSQLMGSSVLSSRSVTICRDSASRRCSLLVGEKSSFSLDAVLLSGGVSDSSSLSADFEEPKHWGGWMPMSSLAEELCFSASTLEQVHKVLWRTILCTLEGLKIFIHSISDICPGASMMMLLGWQHLNSDRSPMQTSFWVQYEISDVSVGSWQSPSSLSGCFETGQLERPR